MKNVVYLVLLLCCFACSKEGELSNEIDFSNVYAIEDDASNAVQHERYLIYKEYKISVYFNDTISRAFVRNDIYGNPVYRYETVDPRWVFFNDSDQRINGTFEYVYTQEEERQLRSLQMIRMFLEETSDALRPTIIFAVDTARVLNGNVMSAPYAYRSNFRSLLWTGLADKDSTTVYSEIAEMKVDFVSNRISNYTEVVDAFGAVSESGWYGQTNFFQYDYYDMWNYFWTSGYWGRYQTFWGRYEMGDYSRATEWAGWYGEYVEDPEYQAGSKAAYCAVVGPYGFVRGSSYYDGNAPVDVNEDLGWYLDLMLFYSREEFEQYWGDYPLVMEKYQILYDLIVNEFGLEL